MPDVRRTQDASNKKLQEAAKKRKTPGGEGGTGPRKSPAGRRLEALRARKAKE